MRRLLTKTSDLISLLKRPRRRKCFSSETFRRHTHQSHKHTHTHTQTHSHTHTHIHTQTHSHTHTHSHTFTHSTRTANTTSGGSIEMQKVRASILLICTWMGLLRAVLGSTVSFSEVFSSSAQMVCPEASDKKRSIFLTCRGERRV